MPAPHAVDFDVLRPHDLDDEIAELQRCLAPPLSARLIELLRALWDALVALLLSPLAAFLRLGRRQPPGRRSLAARAQQQTRRASALVRGVVALILAIRLRGSARSADLDEG